MKRIAVLVLVAACSKAPAREAPRPDDWSCFERDPTEPALPQGDVTHTRQRLIDGGITIESVHMQAGRGGATRLAFKPVGDHLEATLGGVDDRRRDHQDRQDGEADDIRHLRAARGVHEAGPERDGIPEMWVVDLATIAETCLHSFSDERAPDQLLFHGELHGLTRVFSEPGQAG